MPKRLAFISWSIANTRADGLAHHLGSGCHYIRYFHSSRYRYWIAPFKYLLASRETWSVLRKERPEMVLVTNPPPFAVLIVWVYCRMTGGRFITDNHSAAFNLRRWKLFSWLTRFLARRAATNILHSEPMARRVAAWGVRTMVLGDIPFHLETSRTFPSRAGFSLVFPCTFAEDEPVQIVVEAARQLPEVNFYLTGNSSRAPKDFTLQVPQNVILTGYLPHEDYVALLKACQGVIALTTRDLTVQNSAYEAVELERPVITSDWPVLRSTYPLGAIYVDNTAQSLVEAVRLLQRDYPRYRSEIERLRDKLHSAWSERLSTLLSFVE
jgi:glycosyltransferase involved in cell wall biosynthesis